MNPSPVAGSAAQTRRFDLSSSVHLSDRYAAVLLSSLGADVTPPTAPEPLDAARDWADSGLVPLIGLTGRAPLPGPGAIATCASGALAALRLLAGEDILPGCDGAWLLSERAAFLHLERRGATSANGSCRLLATADGWLALNLARDEDWQLLPAWLEAEVNIHDWDSLLLHLSSRSAEELESRGRLLGLPVARAVATGGAETVAGQDWFRVNTRGLCRSSAAYTPPLVVDISSLWAGPLCAHLLAQAGARVIKVEDSQRPDGARRGNGDFYDLLNAGKQSVAIDFRSHEGREQLRALIEQADIVIEASRPRALRQMDIYAEDIVGRRKGLTWISITGYGRGEPQAQWVAFGDDAAVAAGATVGDPPLFCGDALADPLTGLHAAVAGWAFWQSGGGALLDLSLAGVTRHCLRTLTLAPNMEVIDRGGRWYLSAGDHEWPVAAPRRRQVLAHAAPCGADTRQVMLELGIPC